MKKCRVNSRFGAFRRSRVKTPSAGARFQRPCSVLPNRDPALLAFGQFQGDEPMGSMLVPFPRLKGFSLGRIPET
ncbi:hypothetical protein K0M31_007948 [Melipona bicolor]|uniref:Uncharacterized protein n=1 Tax=Melipona bicolor TaxID=60889 RepID=A0AA40GCC6_9HYME|nr:hypothetical protein K0M31_007948 [Melipona bicolor]